MKYTINVKQKHIDSGVRLGPMTCPIARAINDKFCFNCNVQNETVRIHSNGKKSVSKLPVKARNFIDHFDAGDKVKPFKFVIYIDKSKLPNIKVRK